MKKNELICVRCNKLVEKNKELYEVFEKMHWLCFHLEFEHEGDPDIHCDDPSCPWWLIKVYKEKLKSMGLDPEEIMEQAIKEHWNL
jgi:predicted nucleotidyltransferase